MKSYFNHSRHLRGNPIPLLIIIAIMVKMNSYFMRQTIPPSMIPNIRFLSIRFRAIAQATEVEARVLKAMEFASGTKEITTTRTSGHFGTPITVFEVELLKAQEIRKFIDRLGSTGILSQLAGQADARTDEDCAFHFRFDKQGAFLGTLALAESRDVIDVRMKVGIYPASRDGAVRVISEWLDTRG
jgi:RNA binding exosome subunit